MLDTLRGFPMGEPKDMHRSRFFAFAAVLLVVGPPSFAQKTPSKPTMTPQATFERPKSKYPPGLTPPIVPRARMLLEPAIQKELKLSAAMIKKITTEYDKPVSPKDKPLEMEQMRVKWLAKEAMIVGWLTKPQYQRLSEISYQAIDILAIRSEPARKALKLTDAQDKKLIAKWDEIFAAARKEAQKDPPPKVAKNDPKRREKLDAAMDRHDAIYDKYYAQARAFANTVLTPAQQATWKKLQGKPFPLTRKMKR